MKKKLFNAHYLLEESFLWSSELTVSSEDFHLAETQTTLDTDKLQEDILSHKCSGADEGLRDTLLYEFDLWTFN